MKAIWHIAFLILRALLVIFGAVSVIRFNHTHDLYYGIDGLICMTIALMCKNDD